MWKRTFNVPNKKTPTRQKENTKQEKDYSKIFYLKDKARIIPCFF